MRSVHTNIVARTKRQFPPYQPPWPTDMRFQIFGIRHVLIMALPLNA